MESRVFFIAESSRFDTSSCREHGDAIFLFREGEVSPFNSDRLFAEIHSRLLENDYDQDRDYIAVTGPAALVALFLCYLGAACPRFSALLFDARHQRYKPRTVALQGVLDGSQAGL